MTILRESTQECHHCNVSGSEPSVTQQTKTGEDGTGDQILPFSIVCHSKEKAFGFTDKYVTDAERELSLSMPIDKGLIDLIGRFFYIPDILFEESHSNLNLSADKRQIEGTCNCSAYSAYSKLMPNDGRSVYRWGLRMDEMIDCYRSVGVITEKDRKGFEDRSYAHWMKESSTGYDDNGLYFSGFVQRWALEETIVVELDYGKKTMSIYRIPKDSPKTLYGTVEIEPSESYYFGLLLCTSPQNQVTIVELDESGNVKSSSL